MDKIDLFNTAINDLNFEDIISLSSISISKNSKISIGYVNPHLIRLLQSNSKLQKAISDFDFIHADGFGMFLASRILINKKNTKPFNWTDYGLEFLRYCELNKWRIFFLGNKTEILYQAIDNIRSAFPEIQISGYLNGYDQLNEKTLDLINQSDSQIIWIGLGSPKQELWLADNFKKMNINVAQCVGDILSHIAGKRIRGPKLLRDLGFEWLFRLIQHPFRYFNRYVLGIPYFLYLIIKYKIKKS